MYDSAAYATTNSLTHSEVNPLSNTTRNPSPSTTADTATDLAATGAPGPAHKASDHKASRFHAHPRVFSYNEWMLENRQRRVHLRVLHTQCSNKQAGC